ncbi:DNA (cytosine-5-)-methyltransferase [Aeromonas salmonicida]|uniref:DNA cytosine methyltransferase n=1 Tax=Aeromonas salmonicida TaxID=645 RepID=UPI000F7794D4|nr:DNA cytosine methyltransferase [Aeromonas salmonicida]RSM29569.1 DNA (cytosine-5-)-methyltransferase [Aeromonas salmonicida]
MLRTLDLFSGCGGLSYGLAQAGYNIIAACEKDNWASETYTYNHPDVEMICQDIRDISLDFWRDKYNGKIDLIAGGPPCQGFSISGKRQYGIISETNSLVTNFINVVSVVEPTFVLIENVKGFKTGSLSKDKKVFDYLLLTLEALGYHVYHDTINAEDYGVPSLRSRVFIIGSKIELLKPPFPSKTHLVSVDEAISDLPFLEANEGIEGLVRYNNKPENDYQKKMREGSFGVFNHVSMKHTQRLVDRFKTIPQGEGSYRLGRKNNSGEIVTVYKMNNQRLKSNKPAQCITANFQSTFIHPIQHRNLTAREAARLMGFPDRFIFKGKRTQMSSKFLKKYNREHEDFLSQYNQIGNSVPPLLAELIGSSLLNSIPRDFFSSFKMDKNSI